MRPHILALDEPVAMLDPLGKAMVLAIVRELNEKFGTTVVIAESGTDIEAVSEFADQMVLIDQGRILAKAPPEELFANRDMVEQAGLNVPQVTRLFWQLDNGFSTRIPATLDEAYDEVSTRLAADYLTVVPSAEPPAPPVDSGESQPVIIVKNLHKVFPGEPPVHALNGINLTVNKGEMIALLGQNGSGKTTLSYHLVGLEKPTNRDAEIIVDGVDVIHAPLAETVRHINYLFQNPANQLFCETFGEEVSFGPKQLGYSEEEVEQIAHDALRLMDLDQWWDYNTLAIPRSDETLLSLASVLAMKPNILIADEPTGGLDHAAGTKVMETLLEMNRRGETVIVITHDMELAATYANRIIVLRHGEVLLDDTPEEVFRQSDVLASTQLYPPQITRLAQRLAPSGIPNTVLHIDQMAALLKPVPAPQGS
jgi:energy-coupling factor transporter ATP-binding protein EcfA2